MNISKLNKLNMQTYLTNWNERIQKGIVLH